MTENNNTKQIPKKKKQDLPWTFAVDTLEATNILSNSLYVTSVYQLTPVQSRHAEMTD